MFDPKEQYNNPDWELLSAYKIEGQFFERKVTADNDKIAEAISAFANSNPEGGLIVLGIEDGGVIKGLDHLGTDKISQLQKSSTHVSHQVNQKLVCAKTKDMRDATLLFIYSPFSPARVIENTKGKAFKRVGDSTIELRNEERRELEYTKGQIQFEDEIACPLDTNEVSEDVIKEIRQMVQERDGITAEVATEKILCNRFLAVMKDGKVYLTNAGLLLLSKDPRRYIPGAYVRLLRYSGKEALIGKEQNLIKDQDFFGPMPQVVHRVRDFIKAQLKEFSYRGAEGLFVTEPEYPEEAWDEALVNALVHRSYSFRNNGIIIRMFDDRLEVISPGDYPKGIMPENFKDNPLSNPRNPHMMEIMKGLRFVKMISEGTKRMITAMERASLPLPEFSSPGRANVTVTLKNDIERRNAERMGTAPAPVTSFTNLFPLEVVGPPSKGLTPDETSAPPSWEEIKNALISALRGQGYAVDSFTKNVAVDFRREHVIPVLRNSKLVSLYPSIEFRILEFGSNYYLCIDPGVEVRNRATLDQIISLIPNISHRRIEKGFYREGTTWQPCFVRELSKDSVTIETLGFPSKKINVSLHDLLPNIPTTWLSELLAASGVKFDLYQEIKRLSLSNVSGASRRRSEKTIVIAGDLKQRVFPLQIRSYHVNLSGQPRRFDTSAFREWTNLKETEPVFDPQGRSRSTVVQGLTELGSYEKPQRAIPLVVLCTADAVQSIKNLVDILSRGAIRYQGLERTFGMKFSNPNFLVTNTCEEYAEAVKKFHENRDAGQHPFFLVYAPERGYSRADHNAPYYQVKHYLLENGYPSQMVDEQTLADTRFKELNLALDIFAKEGYVPWVLNEGLPGADLFIGMSYSSIRDNGRLSRILAYVNVFDEYGRWQYYKGNSLPIPFEQRNSEFRKLIGNVVSEYQTRNMLQRVHIHHSSKLSRDDRNEIAQGILQVAPEAEVSFVYINTRTPIRLYDSRSDGDGSLSRGSYIITGPNQFYISTTGSNAMGQKALGTPQPLEVTVRRVNARDELDIRTYAQHILSLTKLNWASSKTFCHEPITIKYASDIAYLMNVFMTTFGQFKLHPDLERTAWFL